jgi:transaldolase/glucose-6-phosphate isomerase
MTKLNQLANSGQAIWLDFIRRAFITSGQLQELVDQGLRGVTSNPSIFEKAIAGSADYDTDLRELVSSGRSVEEIYEALALEDIRLAADILRPVYDATGGADGYVSLEVSPDLAHDSQGTLAEAERLFKKLARPNVMIKIPATPAGIPAIEAAIAKGINVNVTLIFSLAHYEAVAEAYITGLERLAAAGGDVSKVASVASFFISRVDAAVDMALAQTKEGASLQGKIAIANAKVSYARFKDIFSGERWEKLTDQGARVQRPLWASTSTKNPTFPDTLYVDGLVGPDTVNTVPPATLVAFMEHGKTAPTLEIDVDQALDQLARLDESGINLDTITQKLQDDGVAAFVKSFESLMASTAEKREILLSERSRFSAELGSYTTSVDSAIGEIERHRIINRIWAHDYTVWKPEPTEISNRLGWLHIMEMMQAQLPRMQALVQSVRKDGYTHALLLGMGGSSLAPEVFRKTYGVREGFLDLAVLDSTDPGAVLAQTERLDLAKTLFIVATKSGGTVETLSFLKYFYNRTLDAVGRTAGEHFIAITDPGSKLEELAQEYNFREVFRNDPNIGGRYSALSYFGLVPASLVGVDVATLLERALTAAVNCDGCNSPADGDNRGAQLGAMMGESAKAGRDKITLIPSPGVSSFGGWVEQLIAESTGKEGKGILPVVGEPLGVPDVYGSDRLFVYLRLDGDETYDEAVLALESSGHPVVTIRLKDPYDLGEQIFLWEMATAVAGYRLGINPFDQPNVESAKVLARQMVAAYQEQGELPETTPVLQAKGIGVYGDLQASTPGEALNAFLASAQPGAYVALQVFLQPTPETDASLLRLRERIRDHTHLATTLGYGPRFLHSTGQLHKGDAGRGLFIQFTADNPRDADIPDEAGSDGTSISFGVLEMAQVLGDAQALQDADRQMVRFHLGDDANAALAYLARAIE